MLMMTTNQHKMCNTGSFLRMVTIVFFTYKFPMSEIYKEFINVYFWDSWKYLWGECLHLVHTCFFNIWKLVSLSNLENFQPVFFKYFLCPYFPLESPVMLEMHLSYIWSLWGFYILGGRAAVRVHSVPLPPAICHLVPLNTRFSTVASWNMNFFIPGGKNSIGIIFIALFEGSHFSCLRYFYFFTHLFISTQLHIWEGL